MTHRHKRVAAVTSTTDGSTTSGDLLTGVTVIPVGNSDDFQDGTHVLIDGEVYTYDHELVDDGEESGQPSITLDSGLVADVADDTAVDLWNASDGTTVIEWQATVTDDIDGTAGTATLLHTLIPFLPAGMPLAEGDSVTVMADAEGDWWIVDVPGKKAAFDPQHIATGSLSAETTITAGDPDGKRVAMNGTEGAFEAFDSTNDQTVKVDGAANYMEGTFATAKPGEPRVAMGPGLLGGDPTNEVRLDSENPNETAPAVLSAFAIGPISVLALTGAATSGPGSSSVQVTGDSVGIAGGSVSVSGATTFLDLVHATMGDGSIGSGDFADEIIALISAAINALVDSSPAALDTLNELAAALGDDANFASTVTTALAAKQPLHAILTDLAAQTIAADTLVYGDGSNSFATTTISSYIRGLIAQTGHADARAVLLARALRRTINSQTTDYTLLASDEEKIIQVNSGSARVITVPNDTTATTPNGYEVQIVRIGAGTLTLATDGGVNTINSRSGLLAVSHQYGVVNLRKRAANTWIASGDLA